MLFHWKPNKQASKQTNKQTKQPQKNKCMHASQKGKGKKGCWRWNDVVVVVAVAAVVIIQEESLFY